VAVDVRPVRPQDVAQLATELRPSDAAEILATGYQDIHAALMGAVTASVMCWSWFVDDELACIMGVGPFGDSGAPWMIGTSVCEKHARILITRPPEYIAKMLKAFPHLVNYVHAKNTTSVRWLKCLGFTIHEAAPYGPTGEAFHKFELRG
jgi:hypothetical protein